MDDVDKSTPFDVMSILSAATEVPEHLSIEVTRDTPLEIDLGNFTAYNSQPIDPKSVRKANTDEFLKTITRDSAQLFINALFSLPATRKESAVIVDLPIGTTPLPREKPLPKEKPLTRWEKFAKAKGIQKQKRSRMLFDEQAQDWKPRYGYKRANDDQNDWLIEVPENGDIYEDQFAKRSEEKKQRITKNRTNQLKNLERTASERIKANLPVPAVSGKNPVREVRKKELVRQLESTKFSTASVGKFDKAIENEPKVKNMGRKRKYEASTGDLQSERKRLSEIADRLVKKASSSDPVKKS